MALAPIIMPIVSVFKSQGIKGAQGAVSGLSKNFGQLAGTLGKAAGAFAGFQAVASARSFVIESVEATQKFERNMLALQQTFETATPTIARFTKEVENYGLSQQQAAQASVFLGSVLKQYGFSVSESADQTQRLVTLAQDLATTYGYDVQDSLLAITALFRGEYDPIEKFGVAMKQNEINAYLAAKGLGDLTGAELANAQATARLELLFERAGDSVGAFTRASDTLYGSQQRLNAVMGNLQVAFGSAFQKPLADVNNALANVAQDGGEHLIDISGELGSSIESLAPLLESLGGLLISLLGPLEQIIAVAGGAAGALGKVLAPLIDIGTGALDQVNLVLDDIALQFKKLDEAQQVKPGQETILDKLLSPEYNRIGTFLMDLDGQMDKLFTKMESRTKLGEALLFDGVQATEARRDATLVERIAFQMEQAALAAEEAGRKTAFYSDGLRSLGINAKDAEGNLIGLAGVFVEIDIAARQSEAGAALEEIGFSAAQIENIITRPDWAQIFNDIARLAKLAALDISKTMSVTAAAGIYNARAALEESIKTAFGGDQKNSLSGGATVEATDYVQEFFDTLEDEVAKQTARLKLQQMTGSEGLIESILGSSGWQEIWKQIEDGVVSLKQLEDQFYKTAQGAQELADAADADIESLRQQQEEYDALVASLKEFSAAMRELSFTDVLSTIEVQVGRFESAVVGKLSSIKSSLKDALNNGQIFQNAYNQLVDYANKELSALQAIQRQRDALANKYDFVSTLLKSYKDAFTASLNLSSMLSQIEDKTKEITITEISTGTTKVGSALKELQFTLRREYTETIQETSNKSQTLVENFRAMAEKAKAFGENLQKLKQMGLDPQLFNQLVQAGVEAGGETAQALIEGGQDTVSEISQLFKEIGDTGVAVGESVAEQFYNTGEDFASSLLDGIRSQQAAFEETARQMADAFQQNFDVKVGRATQQVADTANLNNQLSAFEQEQQRIANRIAEQEAILTGGTAGPGARMWAEKKLTSYLQQLDNVQGQIAGTQNALDQIQIAPLATGGIALGAALSLIGEGGPEAVIPLDRLDSMLSGKNAGAAPIIYNINVTADTRTGGAKAGEEVINALKKWNNSNGDYQVSLSGFGS